MQEIKYFTSTTLKKVSHPRKLVLNRMVTRLNEDFKTSVINTIAIQ